MKPADRDDRIENEIAGPLRKALGELDEVHRARLGSAIERALDREDQSRQAPVRNVPRIRRFVAGGIAAAGVVAAIVVGARREPTPVVPPLRAVASAAARTAAASALLIPYGRRAEGELPPSTSLVALAGENARAVIGTRVRLTLVGPGRVSVVPAAHPGDLELTLDGGRLLVDYDGRAGGTLRVRSPGAVTTVVGTLFAVDVTPFGSRIAVAHGRVRTEDTRGRAWQVGAGTNWSSADERVSPLADDLAVALQEHEASWAGNVPALLAPEPVRGSPRTRPPAASTPEVNLDILYAQAEAAMRRRATADARRMLETIALRAGPGPMRETALLDLARLALGDGDAAGAQRVLARLPATLYDTVLNETAEHLRCRAASPDAGPRANRP